MFHLTRRLSGASLLFAVEDGDAEGSALGLMLENQLEPMKAACQGGDGKCEGVSLALSGV